MSMLKKIYLLNILFLFPMWMSKTIQPLYWNIEGKLSLFSASYVAMAVAGTFSLIYAGMIRKAGIRNALLLGYLFYGAGLILRAYPLNFTVAVLTGVIAGIGASVTGLALKGLILEVREEKRKQVILQTGNISTLSQSLGALISGLLVSLLALFFKDGYQQTLIVTGLITVAGTLFLPYEKEIRKAESVNIVKKIPAWEAFRTVNKKLYASIFFAFFVHGACWAVIIPLVPVYLKNLALSPGEIGSVISLGVISGFLLKNLYVFLCKNAGKNYSLVIFTVLTCCSLFISFRLLGLNESLLYSVSIVAFYMFRTVLLMIIDMKEVEIANKGHSMAVFGIRQTAFLTGDVAGGIAMPYLYKGMILANHSLVFIMLILFASFMIVSCSKLSERKEWNETLS